MLVILDSYGTIIDELMLRSVKELKEKLTNKKNAPEMPRLYVDAMLRNNYWLNQRNQANINYIFFFEICF